MRLHAVDQGNERAFFAAQRIAKPGGKLEPAGAAADNDDVMQGFRHGDYLRVTCHSGIETAPGCGVYKSDRTMCRRGSTRSAAAASASPPPCQKFPDSHPR